MLQRIWAIFDWIFFGPLSSGRGVGARVLRLLSYPYAVIRDLAGGEINLRAMGLVYTTLLSLVPLIAFSFAILKIFGAHRGLEPIVYEFFRPVGGDAAAELTGKVMQFADSVSSGVVGSLGLALLAWTLLGTIRKVEDSFNYLWRVGQARSFGRRIAEYLTLLVVGPLLLVGFIGLSHATLASAPLRTVARMPVLDRLPQILFGLSPYAMVMAFFTGLYMFIPNTRVQWKPAVVGAAAAGVLWAAVGKMFTAFVVYSTRLTIVYAGFAFIVAALLWTYLGWVILLAGAQLSFYIQNPTYLRHGLQEVRLSSAELEQLALRLMYLAGHAHLSQGRPWTLNRLARELGLPGIAVANMAAALEHAGLVQVSDDSELRCTRDPGRIPVDTVLQVARNQHSGYAAPRNLPIPSVDRLLSSLDELRRTRCAGLTLKDLIAEAEVSRPR